MLIKLRLPTHLILAACYFTFRLASAHPELWPMFDSTGEEDLHDIVNRAKFLKRKRPAEIQDINLQPSYSDEAGGHQAKYPDYIDSQSKKDLDYFPRFFFSVLRQCWPWSLTVADSCHGSVKSVSRRLSVS
jgi:hypothetical protein